MRAATTEKLGTVRCTRCRAAYDERAWEELRLVERVDAHEIARTILRWPAHEHVEVRECARCAKGISARRPARR